MEFSFLVFYFICVSGGGDPQYCETSTPPHFINNRLKAGGEVDSLKSWPPLPSGRYFVLISVRGCDEHTL
jgi:hypothetical protein